MRRLKWLGPIFALPFGAALVVVAVLFLVLRYVMRARNFNRLYCSMATAEPVLEQFRTGLAGELAKQRSSATNDEARALMAIVRNETGLKARPLHGYIGDKELFSGPSIGHGQVYRKTAKELGLYVPTPGISEAAERDEYRELANDDAKMSEWCVAVFVAKLNDDARLDNVKQGQLSGGNLVEAIRLYNGPSSPPASSPGYTASAVAFITSQWGGLA